MSNGDRLPLLLFQTPVPTPKARRFGGGSKFNPRSRDEVASYLGPKLTRLEQALEAERIRVQATGAGIEPEMALVIELATDLGNFAAAARGIGLEWLAEDEIDLDPSETIFSINAKGRRQDKPFRGRLFLTMTDRRALDQLLSRWTRWRDDPKADWPRGETAWRDLFPLRCTRPAQAHYHPRLAHADSRAPATLPEGAALVHHRRQRPDWRCAWPERL